MTDTTATDIKEMGSHVTTLRADMQRLNEAQRARLADLRKQVLTDAGGYDLGRLSRPEMKEWERLVELLIERQEVSL